MPSTNISKPQNFLYVIFYTWPFAITIMPNQAHVLIFIMTHHQWLCSKGEFMRWEDFVIREFFFFFHDKEESCIFTFFYRKLKFFLSWKINLFFIFLREKIFNQTIKEWPATWKIKDISIYFRILLSHKRNLKIVPQHFYFFFSITTTIKYSAIPFFARCVTSNKILFHVHVCEGDDSCISNLLALYPLHTIFENDNYMKVGKK